MSDVATLHGDDLEFDCDCDNPLECNCDVLETDYEDSETETETDEDADADEVLTLNELIFLVASLRFFEREHEDADCIPDCLNALNFFCISGFVQNDESARIIQQMTPLAILNWTELNHAMHLVRGFKYLCGCNGRFLSDDLHLKLSNFIFTQYEEWKEVVEIGSVEDKLVCEIEEDADFMQNLFYLI